MMTASFFFIQAVLFTAFIYFGLEDTLEFKVFRIQMYRKALNKEN